MPGLVSLADPSSTSAHRLSGLLRARGLLGGARNALGKKGKGGGAPVRVPRHREGEEVGGVSDEVHAVTRSRALTTFADRSEDWRVERRLQDVGDDGVE